MLKVPYSQQWTGVDDDDDDEFYTLLLPVLAS